MKYLAILIISVIGLVAADNVGEYIPKAFFTIDANGNPSAARPISAETLNRVRRQIQPIQPFGNVGFGFPQPLFPNFPQGQGTQGTFASSSQSVSSRFGEDEPVYTAQSSVGHHSKGQYHQTNTYTRPDGSVTTNKQSGRVKRQQTQTQSQDTQGGNQLQSQSQNQPGGQQIQTQSQGQGNGLEPAAAPADNQQYNPQQENVQPDNSNQQNSIPQGNQNYNPQYENTQPDNRNGQSFPQQAQPNYPQQAQQNYPQPGFSPFGIGAFGPAGFPQFGQQPFGFVPGFGLQNPFVPFPQPAFGGNFPVAGTGVQGTGTQTAGSTIGLDNRFGEDGPVVTGGTHTITSQNGNFQSTSSILKPDGQVITTQQSGKLPAKK